MPRITLTTPEQAIDYNVPLIAETAAKLKQQYQTNFAAFDAIDQAAKNVMVHEKDAAVKKAAIEELRKRRDQIVANRYSFTGANEDVIAAANQFTTNAALNDAIMKNKQIQQYKAAVEQARAEKRINSTQADYYTKQADAYTGVEDYKVDDFTYKPWIAPKMVNSYDVFGHLTNFMNTAKASLDEQGYKPVYGTMSKTVPIYYEKSGHKRVTFEELLRDGYNSLKGTPEADQYLTHMSEITGKPIFNPENIQAYSAIFDPKKKYTSGELEALADRGGDLIGSLLVGAAHNYSYHERTKDPINNPEFSAWASGVGKSGNPVWIDPDFETGAASANNLPATGTYKYAALDEVLSNSTYNSTPTWTVAGYQTNYLTKPTLDVKELPAKYKADADKVLAKEVDKFTNRQKDILNTYKAIPYIDPTIKVDNDGKVLGKLKIGIAPDGTKYETIVQSTYSMADLEDLIKKRIKYTSMLPVDKEALDIMARRKGVPLTVIKDDLGAMVVPRRVIEQVNGVMKQQYEEDAKNPRDVVNFTVKYLPGVSAEKGKAIKTLDDLALGQNAAYIVAGKNAGGGLFGTEADKAVRAALGVAESSKEKLEVTAKGLSLGGGTPFFGGTKYVVSRNTPQGKVYTSTEIIVPPSEKVSEIFRPLKSLNDVVNSPGVGVVYINTMTGQQVDKFDPRQPIAVIHKFRKTASEPGSTTIEGNMYVGLDDNNYPIIVPINQWVGEAPTYSTIAKAFYKAQQKKLAEIGELHFNKNSPELLNK